jgi:hypothetical protein
MICSSAKMKRGAAFIVVNASNIEKDWNWISAQNDECRRKHLMIIHYWRNSGQSS